MISLGLVFFGFGTKDSPLLKSFVAQVDYCVCGVRLFILLVSCFLAGLRLGEFLTN